MNLNSTHKAEIVPVSLRKHPDADTLSVVDIFGGGYTYVARTEDWQGVTKAAYIPPDSVVDTDRPEFRFLAPGCKGLDSKVRVKAKRLRGIVSYGLMVPVPGDTPLGEDWAERLGVTHYEPPLTHEAKAKGPSLGGDESAPPATYAPRYDVDSFRRYHHLLTPGEPLWVGEKADGANFRALYKDGEFHVGSRERWTREFCDYSHITQEFLTNQGVPDEKAAEIIEKLTTRPRVRNIWWQALRDTPALEQFLIDHPGYVVYAEVAGNVNAIKYGFPKNRLFAFDVLANGTWMDAAEAHPLLERCGVPCVPLLNPRDADGSIVPVPYNFNTALEMAEGPTLMNGAKAGVIREGVVIKPMRERVDARVGRIQFKIVSGTYLERYR